MYNYFRQQETLLALLLFGLVFAYIYPDLFFLTHSPMGGDPSTLKDPTVSWSAFIPAFREFRYELLEHGNLLWSNLRGMGQPILGNTVQGAPLFPLNLLLLALPDPLYWSVMPISRVILISLAAFMISRKVIGLPLLASLLFALLIGFNTNTLRWMNHPWSNGLLAGLWYFYCLCQICLATTGKPKAWFSLGLVVSVFAMITAGFPEATAMSALIVGFLFVGFAASNWTALKPRLGQITALLVTCHIVGFALSSIQIFALLEFIHVSAAMELRAGFAEGSHQKDDFLPYILAQLSILGASKEHQSLLTFSLGLWGLFFAIRGCFAVANGTVKASDGSTFTGFTIAFLACMSLFMVKAFGLSDIVNTVFLSTPILAESHFPLYFSPLFFIGLAFFAALGLAELLSLESQSKRQQLVSILSTVIAFAAVALLSLMALSYFQQIETTQLWSALVSRAELFSLRVFLIATSIIIVMQALKTTDKAARFSKSRPIVNRGVPVALGILLIGLNVVEVSNTVPKRFSPIDFISLGPNQATKTTIFNTFAAAPIAKHELRGANLYGDFAGQGLATIDNGASAILTPEYRLMRRALFNVRYGGYLPLEKPYASWSYQAMSANIRWVHATPKSNPSWQDYAAEKEIASQLTEWPSGTQILANPFYLQGRSLAHVNKYRGLSVWLHFQSLSELSEDFWIEANIASQGGIGISNGRQKIDTRWRIRLPSDWLKSEEYKVTIRQVEPFTMRFDDVQSVSLKLNRTHPEAIRGQGLQLLASSEDLSQHFFFDDDALPRAFIASACQQAVSLEAEVDFYRRDNAVAKGKVIFPFNEDPTATPCDSYKGDFKRVAITEDKQTYLAFEPIQGPALLLLNDSDYPGWKAFDNHQTELSIERANTNGRSVYLPEARTYNLSMIYKPFWLIWVYASLLLAIIFLAIITWLVLGNKHRPISE